MDGAEAVSAPVWATADLCDAYPERLQVIAAGFRDFGGIHAFHGEIATLRSVEDYRPVLRELEEPGRGRVLVVDGGGSLRRAILGERLLGLARRNGWAGVVVYGAVRDSALTASIPTGLRALGTAPCRGESGSAGVRGEALEFAGVRFVPGDRLWADADGMVVGGADVTEAPA